MNISESDVSFVINIDSDTIIDVSIISRLVLQGSLTKLQVEIVYPKSTNPYLRIWIPKNLNKRYKNIIQMGAGKTF